MDENTNETAPEVTLAASWTLFDQHCIHPLMANKLRVQIEKGFYSGAHASLQFISMLLQKGMTPEEILSRVNQNKDEAEKKLSEWGGEPKNN